MLIGFYHTWQAMLVRGAIAVLFGLALYAWPHLTIETVTYLFGVFAVIDGFFVLTSLLINPTLVQGNRAWLWFEGILWIVMGLLVLSWSIPSELFLLYFIAARAFFAGIWGMATSKSLYGAAGGLFTIANILSIVFGLLFYFWPTVSLLEKIWLLACYCIVYGVILIVLSFRLEK